jgi:hypothetical protein
VGDRVICRRNDREVDVDNGTRGTVRAAQRTKIVVETDGRTIPHPQIPDPRARQAPDRRPDPAR